MAKIRCRGCDAVFEEGGDFISHLRDWHKIAESEAAAWSMRESDVHPSRGAAPDASPPPARERIATPVPPRDDDETPAPLPSPPSRRSR